MTESLSAILSCNATRAVLVPCARLADGDPDQLRTARAARPMPKPLYGKGRKSKSRAAQSSDDAARGWLTLITTLPEEQMHTAIVVALREGEPLPLLTTN